ncbi:MAG: rsbT antagonist protein RsbS [Candidatus Azotimanducaceae bacterium]|jgi:rsbT antagonist protein RsbS
MNTYSETDSVGMYSTQSCLVVPIQIELSKEEALNIQKNILNLVYAKNIKGIIIDLSGVSIIDSALWDIFSKTAKMTRMLGFPSVISGLNPGVVASIIDLNLQTDGITTTLNLEDALSLLTSSDQAYSSNRHNSDMADDSENIADDEVE